MKSDQQIFDVKNVALKGRNLVEASAGTGKTYSIGMLVLRMIIEKHIPIEGQLVVTFTKFAVAELQERIRLFVKEAYNAATGRPCSDPMIRSVVERAGGGDTGLRDRLRAALLMLDEAPILTIHGFCQQMLNEFSFETGQPFRLELQTNVDTFVEHAVQKFWRKVISLLPSGVLELDQLPEIREQLRTVFTKALAGQRFLGNIAIASDHDVLEHAQEVISIKAERERALKEIYIYPIANKAALLADIRAAGSAAIKALEPLLEQPRALFDKACELGSDPIPKYYEKLSDPYWRLIEDQLQLSATLSVAQHSLIDVLLLIAQRDHLPSLQESIEQSNVLTFDAMILNLHKILVREGNEKLKALIQAKYKVAFIDEFQDTDIIQFELFKKLFIDVDAAADSTLFLIGDPKQSIYAFRGADVDSYLAASKTVDTVHSMNTNFRSSESMVQALNAFYEAAGSASFGYDEETEGIFYHHVAAKHRDRKFMKHGQVLDDTLLFAPAKNADRGLEHLTDTVAALLDPGNGYTIQASAGEAARKIKPEDIAILVRKRDEGVKAKALLQRHNIPSVTVDDAKVLASQEAEEMILLLEAMIRPDIRKVRSALYLSFLNRLKITIDRQTIDLNKLDDVQLLGIFGSYHELIMENKVYQAFMKLLNDFSVPQHFSQKVAGQRVLSNVSQITELLHQQQYQKSRSAEELLVWLKQSIKANAEGDEYLMQIESDEHAVNILTLHKSKGLEYPIVFMWGVHAGVDVKDDRFYRIASNSGTQDHKLGRNLSTEEAASVVQAEERELRRLIYVGITRAVYRCYVFYSDHMIGKKVLGSLISGLNENVNIRTDLVLEDEVNSYQAENSRAITAARMDKDIMEQSRSNWNLLSYSALSIPHEYEPKPYSNDLKDYDHFIFNELERGANVGTKLHTLFEKVDFRKDFIGTTSLDRSTQKLLASFNKTVQGKEQDRTAMIAALLHNVLHAKIQVGDSSFALHEVAMQQRLNELEFVFPVSNERAMDDLKRLLEGYRTGIRSKYQDLKGMMTGFIDLLFEYEGKYYILDWKSNYLGFEHSAYVGEDLAAAMNSNQYTLQYLIYTVAVHKFLRQRMGSAYSYDLHFGGVIYIFLRGARAGTTSGIFTDRPELKFVTALEAALTQLE